MKQILVAVYGLFWMSALQAGAGHEQVHRPAIHAQQELPTMLHAGDEGWVASAGFQRLEWQQGRDQQAHGVYWDLQASLARDFDRFWLKSEGEGDHGQAHDSQVQLLYSHALSPFWDMQFGWHSQLEPGRQDYLLIGLFGLAPWHVDVDSYLLLDAGGDVTAQIEAGYELKLTQNWLLLTDLEVTARARPDTAMMTGPGLAESEFSLRIGYERLRKLMPYLGAQWWRRFGETRAMHEQHGIAASEWRMVAGIHVWY